MTDGTSGFRAGLAQKAIDPVVRAAGLRGLGRGVPPVPEDTLADVRDRVAGRRHRLP
ncbi:hypothetical protein NB037_10240 [Rathayibacter sp. ZW T2_19]|uniref:Uncharacterized protein n=1 Tax=Rathayibacter rubneri TaxID=2950106 RepID=A0A9X2IUN5_9MICO|nr:hypothetical protein [Rathayibacter rubneri]MCM6762794.1 hypothetical protein [Rathayibacter rubneri]